MMKLQLTIIHLASKSLYLKTTVARYVQYVFEHVLKKINSIFYQQISHPKSQLTRLRLDRIASVKLQQEKH